MAKSPEPFPVKRIPSHPTRLRDDQISCLGMIQYSSPFHLSRPLLSNEIDLFQFTQNHPYETISKSDRMPRDDPDREYLLVNHQEHTSNGSAMRWLTNNGTLDMSRLMHLHRPLIDEGTKKSSRDILYKAKKNELIDLILQNTVALDGVCVTHPFHLHGHKFWLHSQGTGLYQRSTPIDRPVLRDTSILYAFPFGNHTSSDHRQPCGWIKLRFRANNPGLWMLHCHIGAHAVMGMNILIDQF